MLDKRMSPGARDEAPPSAPLPKRQRRRQKPRRRSRGVALHAGPASTEVVDIYTSDDSADDASEVLRKRILRRALDMLSSWDGPLPLGTNCVNRKERRRMGEQLMYSAGLLREEGGLFDAEGDDDDDDDGGASELSGSASLDSEDEGLLVRL
jgi:hypothetical protein